MNCKASSEELWKWPTALSSTRPTETTLRKPSWQPLISECLASFPAPESGWTPQVLTYSGFYNIGIKEIWDMIYAYIDFVRKNGYFERRRNEQAKYWMYETINEHLRDSFYQNPQIASLLPLQEQEVLEGKATSFSAARKLLDMYFLGLK